MCDFMDFIGSIIFGIFVFVLYYLQVIWALPKFRKKTYKYVSSPLCYDTNTYIFDIFKKIIFVYLCLFFFYFSWSHMWCDDFHNIHPSIISSWKNLKIKILYNINNPKPKHCVLSNIELSVKKHAFYWISSILLCPLCYLLILKQVFFILANRHVSIILPQNPHVFLQWSRMNFFHDCWLQAYFQLGQFAAKMWSLKDTDLQKSIQYLCTADYHDRNYLHMKN